MARFGQALSTLFLPAALFGCRAAAATEASRRPGQDAEEEAFLRANFQRLCGEAVPSYDPATGEFAVEYSDGSALRQDAIFPEPGDRKNVVWIDPEDPVDFNRPHLPLPDPYAEERKTFVFHGGKSGSFLFPWPFEGSVTLEVKLQVGLKRSDGGIWPVSRSAKDGPSRTMANLWPGKRGGECIRVRQDFDLSAGGGRVGLRWKDVKFTVRGLRISGKIDRKEAVRILREKLREEAGRPEDRRAAALPNG